mmetsp:Transcript_21870/g.38790  ORF Transcript_21870/g.38790 Transcript_21870/m.38790 type:complete len:288 (-) Transcript_21870:2013-2876(-)
MRPAELLRRVVEGSAEPRTDGQETRTERRDQILPRTRSNDRVVGARDCRSVVGGDHEHHFDEFAEVGRQLAAEPEEAEDAAQADLLLEDLGELHAAVDQLLAALVGDRGHERRRLADEPELACPFVVHRHLGGLRLFFLDDHARLHELPIRRADANSHVVERRRHHRARLLQRPVLRGCGLLLPLRAGPRVAKLHFVGEGVGTRARTQGDERFVDFPRLDRVADLVLLDATHLSEQHQHLDFGVFLVSHEVVHECGSGEAVAADGNALVDSVGVLGDNVVELVGQTA